MPSNRFRNCRSLCQTSFLSAEADAAISQPQPNAAEPAQVLDLDVPEPPRQAPGSAEGQGPDRSARALQCRGEVHCGCQRQRPVLYFDPPAAGPVGIAGFGADDRLLLDWSGKALSIARTAEGGVKPKAIGGTSVVLQSWKLGNLNFDQPKVTNGEGSLHLTARLSGTP